VFAHPLLGRHSSEEGLRGQPQRFEIEVAEPVELVAATITCGASTLRLVSQTQPRSSSRLDIELRCDSCGTERLRRVRVALGVELLCERFG
jgi:hypothetical protein